jgi:predicted dehydrogenase
MTATSLGTLERLRKVLRFVAIYGPSRTFFKAAGRLRFRPPSLTPRRAADIGFIGCGQFAFATIGYFLQRAFGPRVLACHDVDTAAANSLARGLRVARVCPSADELLAMPGLRLVYIASNHASHADYAARALDRGLDVYVEKPIAVNHEQLIRLLRARAHARGRLFAGYNRPFSAAIRELRARTTIDPAGGITLQCFVAGHRLAPDHWYRRPEEGTRVCGNVGHWLDLFVHMLCWRGLPDRLEIGATWADDAEPDDNVCISIRSDRADLFSVLLTSRSEPFEGINETINFQHGETICKIDDFRRLTLWQGAQVRTRRFWPKDVGHRDAILQPFGTGPGRDWHEVKLSTLLMLHIADMVRRRKPASTFSFAEQWAAVESALAGPPESPLHPLHLPVP